MSLISPIYAISDPVVADPRDVIATAAYQSERRGQFEAVSGAASEQVSASVVVVAAYGLLWVMAIAFVYLTYRSQTRLAARIAELELRVTKEPHLP